MQYIKKAAANRLAILGEDREIGNQNLRSDLVIQKDNEIIIFDVTVPFDNDLKDFEGARRLKKEKYRQLVTELSINGRQAGCRRGHCCWGSIK